MIMFVVPERHIPNIQQAIGRTIMGFCLYYGFIGVMCAWSLVGMLLWRVKNCPFDTRALLQFGSPHLLGWLSFCGLSAVYYGPTHGWVTLSAITATLGIHVMFFALARLRQATWVGTSP
jgi:hypothetical protein